MNVWRSNIEQWTTKYHRLFEGLAGFVVGFTFAFIAFCHFYNWGNVTRFKEPILCSNQDDFSKVLRGNYENGYIQSKSKDITTVEGSIPLRRRQDNTPEGTMLDDDYSVADNIYEKVRVLCWVMTQPKNLETRARHIKTTWGKRCHKLLFFSSVANDTFPTIALNYTHEDRSQLNKKTLAAFQYVYEHYWNDYDWFMRTDDDAYVIMENLRYFLSGQDTNGTFYFGHHFKTIVPVGYFSGGPGIILGREALKRYATASKNSSLCFQGETFADDAELGKCLYKVGIVPGNSTDRLGRSRFHCFNPGTHLMKNYPDWYYKYDANGAHGGRDSMSDYAIGFHYVNDVKINELEYYVYHLRPYGVRFAPQNLNQRQSSMRRK